MQYIHDCDDGRTVYKEQADSPFITRGRNKRGKYVGGDALNVKTSSNRLVPSGFPVENYPKVARDRIQGRKPTLVMPDFNDLKEGADAAKPRTRK
jgi:hypothetical protein